MSDNALNYFLIHAETKKLTSFSVRLAPDTVREGKVVDQASLVRALKELRAQLPGHYRGNLPVVLSLSDVNVYSQMFSVPSLGAKEFKDAVMLNMQTNSPMDFSHMYADWEEISMDETTQERVILASYVERALIDPICQACAEAGFMVMAIEQKAASVMRLIKSGAQHFEEGMSYIVLAIDSDGMSFSVMRQGRFFFNRFVGWREVTGAAGVSGGISLKEFHDVVVRELYQVYNFYSSRSHDVIKGIFVQAPGFEDQLTKIIQENFAFPIYVIEAGSFPVEKTWNVVLGTALRGLIPRSQDKEISIAPEDTAQKFFHMEVLLFLGLWKNVILALSFILVIAHLGAFVFLREVAASIAADVRTSYTNASALRLEELKKEADEFNLDMSRALSIQQRGGKKAQVIRGLYEKAGSGVIIDRINFSGGGDGTVQARTTSEAAAMEYKAQVEKISGISGVNMPLSGMTQLDKDTLSFKLIVSVGEVR